MELKKLVVAGVMCLSIVSLASCNKEKLAGTELAKILLILFFAQFIMKYREYINSFKFLIICAVLLGIPLLLVYMQLVEVEYYL